MNAKKNIAFIALTALVVNTASAGMLDVLSASVSSPQLCTFPVPARLNSNYKDVLNVNAVVRGELAEYLDEECSGGSYCQYSLTIFKNDLTKVTPTFLVQASEMGFGHIILAEDTYKFLSYDQTKLTVEEFPSLEEGSDEGTTPNVLHAILKVTKPIVSPFKPAQVVATWSASGFVMSYPEINRPLGGKCVEDAYNVQFEFGDGGSIVD